MGLRTATGLAELLDAVDDLSQPLEVEPRQFGAAWSHRGSRGLVVVGGAHGDSRVGAIRQAEDQVGIDAAADADHGTSLAVEGMLGMGDGHRFQRRLE